MSRRFPPSLDPYLTGKDQNCRFWGSSCLQLPMAWAHPSKAIRSSPDAKTWSFCEVMWTQGLEGQIKFKCYLKRDTFLVFWILFFYHFSRICHLCFEPCTLGVALKGNCLKNWLHSHIPSPWVNHLNKPRRPYQQRLQASQRGFARTQPE